MKKTIFLVLLTLTLIGCSSTKKKTERLVFKEEMVQITIDSLNIQELPKGTDIIFKLWGYDLQIGDAKATLLKEYKYKLSELPVTYGLNYRKEWNEKINPKASEKYGYYVTLEFKNKDGKIYKVDYETTDKDYFGTRKTKIEELSARIYIKQLK
jgi:hypothetical protein